MSKCEAWHIRGGRLPKEPTYECWGTRERDACSCGGDQMKCDFYPEIREKATKELAGSNSLGEKFWHDAKQDPPKENGIYLAYYSPFGNGMAQVLTYALDLGEACPIDFEGEHRPGWYEYDSEWGYIESNNVLYWADIPTTPMITAKREPEVQAAIAYYNRGISEGIFSPEVAAYARLAVEALKRWERTDEQTHDCRKD